MVKGGIYAFDGRRLRRRAVEREALGVVVDDVSGCRRVCCHIFRFAVNGIAGVELTCPLSLLLFSV